MNQQEKDLMQRWVETWRNASKELEKLRHEEIRSADTQLAIERLDDAFEAALLHFPLRPSSGLVEQQRLFHKCQK